MTTTQQVTQMTADQKKSLLTNRLVGFIKKHGGFREIPSFVWHINEDAGTCSVTSEAQAALPKEERVGLELPLSIFGGEVKQGQRWAVSMKSATLTTSLQKLAAIEPSVVRIKSADVALDEAAFAALTEGK